MPDEVACRFESDQVHALEPGKHAGVQPVVSVRFWACPLVGGWCKRFLPGVTPGTRPVRQVWLKPPRFHRGDHRFKSGTGYSMRMWGKLVDPPGLGSGVREERASSNLAIRTKKCSRQTRCVRGGIR